jgi:hypothetical protein
MLLALLSFCLLGCHDQVSQVSPLASPLRHSPVSSPTPAGDLTQVEFYLNEPLIEGDTRVSGGGVAGVPINIVDVSRMVIIGSGTVGQDNRFSIKTNEPLVAYSIIGVLVDESRPSPYTMEQLPCGETCRDQPLVGKLLSRAPVRKLD